ncbi:MULTISPECIES: translation initiation factor IF-2 subunit gamma [Acidiplasma]|jgi:translation initiation factor 2 subunit 3|uniref:protein-synthesizing GTPase n=2 Tax=Acidiplasma TaxID=507753 RepID=A0A0Q0VU42_9ARCH|nr:MULTISPECIES: translation initiation factor IF-2 subunit gamma [Acidiplasma]KJE49474.1 translation initiation factor IF-2 subunit gamma [Acidiplasma sp. MBA-1]KPV46350.1 translation initiation factor IF-2 subunit gamma [Acidiplasma aeolicum]KQB35133.1 translation initiation factor IF-2 subunit gamma [Acidiplasma cupricumulans]KQB36712.1 translation initiation factor IF-2 subunit gamma [Acidiplasma aeolicum]WMT54545.1 MAG: translation initiation factor IF-2 subunit gamma [Acidiplasma sp.]
MQQPSVNIGMVGHVDHGKSTLTYALTGKKTDVHSEEVKRGISIKLGYADTPIYKCVNAEGKVFYSNKKINDSCELSRVISIVDAPGHETLMATMLAGSSIMNGAILVIAANEKCPQPQTREHLTALEIMGIKEIIVVQNKIDLVTRERAIESYNEIKAFLKGSIAENAPIIPVSAYHNTNIDVVLEAIENIIKTPKFNENDDPIMYVARSFDVNKPGTKIKDLKGGVLGGSLIRGMLSVGDEIEISPGIQINRGNKTVWENMTTRIVSLMAGSESYDRIYPGGLAAVGTTLDPFLTKGDSFTGRVIGRIGKVPKTIFNLSMDSHLLKRVVGFDEEQKVEPLKINEMIMLTVGTANTIGVITSIKDGNVEVSLKYPVAASIGDRIAIGRRISNRWRLIGYGSIKNI